MSENTKNVAMHSDRLRASVPRGVSTRELFFTRAENAELWDTEGRRYIDFSAGIGVLNTGHRHPRVIEAVTRQMESFTHTCFNVEEALCDRAMSIGNTIRQRLEALATTIPAIGHVRGIGAMQAIELVRDSITREPDATLTASVIRLAQSLGLILLSCGTAANVIRLLTPFTIPFETLDEGLCILADAVREATHAARTKSAAIA